MKKRLIKTVLGIGGLCLCLSACSKLGGSNGTSEGVEGDNNTSKEVSHEFTNVSKPINGKNDEDAIRMKDGLQDETLVAVQEEQEANDLLGVNIKEDNYEVLLCKDTVYDMVYYVNYGIDYFIYRIKDGKSELVVEIPANRLFSINGKLYFMLESYDIYTLKDMEDGNIFCYNPVTGQVSMISDANASTMYVYEDGIYYKVETPTKEFDNGTTLLESDSYYYSFATSKSETIDDNYITLYKWKDYHITYEKVELDKSDELYEIYGTENIITKLVGLKLETLDKTKSIELTDNPLIQNYTIVGNKLYYILKSKCLLIFNIETKETEEISLAINCSRDFTLFNGMIYLDSLLQIDPETGLQSLITSESEMIEKLYTDGENLYGVCKLMGNNGTGVLKRIELEETPDNVVIKENEQGMSYEMFRYVFHTLPMGEEH